MTQGNIVASHLEEWGEITSIEAIMRYRITRLSAVICELRKKGWKIQTIYERGVSESGGTTRYARYMLVKARAD